MKFYLFSKIEFEIPDPVYLIECYCYQSDFYSKYDVIVNRKIEDVNKIGARLASKVISDCNGIVEGTRELEIFQKTLEQFLDLHELEREKLIKELNKQVFQKLFKINGSVFLLQQKFCIPFTPKLSQ